MFLDHTQRRSTVGRTPLDEWSARRRDLYLTTHDTHNRQIFMPPVGFEQWRACLLLNDYLKVFISEFTFELPCTCTIWNVTDLRIFLCGAKPQRGSWPPHSWGFYITHNDAPQSVELLWTSDQLVAATSTWQRTTLTTNRQPCPRWDSSPRSQQASGRRPTPSTARPLGPAI